MKKSTLFVSVFWSLLVLLLAWDWLATKPHDRFDEPPPWALGQPAVEGAGHCAAPLNLK